MRPYKLKHVPTGLYYQPGNNLSYRGKIYQTGTHGLSSAIKRLERDKTDDKFSICVKKDSKVHKETIDILSWTENRWSRGYVKASTKTNDWIIEEI